MFKSITPFNLGASAFQANQTLENQKKIQKFNWKTLFRHPQNDARVAKNFVQ